MQAGLMCSRVKVEKELIKLSHRKQPVIVSCLGICRSRVNILSTGRHKCKLPLQFKVGWLNSNPVTFQLKEMERKLTFLTAEKVVYQVPFCSSNFQSFYAAKTFQ